MSFLFGLVPSLVFAAAVPGREAHTQKIQPRQENISLSLSNTETALFAGGHFWNLERYFAYRHKEGVVSTSTGYSGGTTDRPTAALLEKGGTGHREVVQIVFNPAKLSYERLVEQFLRQTDPYDDHGQFCDQGDQFRSAIYYENENQRRAAEKVLHRLEGTLGHGKFATALLPAKAFYPAEPLNQEFYETNPVSYKLYIFGCGRDERLEAVWGGGARAGNSPPAQ